MRKVVDTMLIDQLKNLQTQLEGAKKAGKKARKGRRARRKKGKKGRKGKGKEGEKKAKGKKGKLPGEKYCKDLKLGQMIELLVEAHIIKNWGVHQKREGRPKPSIADFKGTFDYLGHIKLAQLGRRRASLGDA